MNPHRFSERLLEGLPSLQREVLALRLLRGLSAKEVAAELSMDVALVQRIQQQGWAEIQQRLHSA